jgi:hypothetical protein
MLVPVDYHQFWIQEPGRRRGPVSPEGNGLVVAAGPGSAMVLTGISTGRVEVEAEAMPGPPPLVDLDAWDEIVEISVSAPAGRLAVAALMDAGPVGLPRLCAEGPGFYRVRVHARGRDNAPDEASCRPVEAYRILTWPAPPGPDLAHKLTDRFGAAVRRVRR